MEEEDEEEEGWRRRVTYEDKCWLLGGWAGEVGVGGVRVSLVVPKQSRLRSKMFVSSFLTAFVVVGSEEIGNNLPSGSLHGTPQGPTVRGGGRL